MRESKQRSKAQLDLAKEHYQEQVAREVANAVKEVVPGMCDSQYADRRNLHTDGLLAQTRQVDLGQSGAMFAWTIASLWCSGQTLTDSLCLICAVQQLRACKVCRLCQPTRRPWKGV